VQSIGVETVGPDLRPGPARSSWGTGLSPPVLGAMLSCSVLLFLLWPRVLWRTHGDDSHVARILVSYLAILPAVAIALAWVRRFSLSRLASGVGVLWSAKLLVTSTLFFALAPGAAQSYAPEPGTPRRVEAPPTAAASYQPAVDGAALHQVAGRVTREGRPVANAIVWIEAPPPGRAEPAPSRTTIALGDAGFPARAFSARSGDSIELSNEGATLHSVRVARSGRMLANHPLPAGAAPSALPPLAPGLYQLSCASHPGERAVLVVVDHPFVARTDADGRFAFEGVGEGALDLRAEAGDERDVTISRAGVR